MDSNLYFALLIISFLEFGKSLIASSSELLESVNMSVYVVERTVTSRGTLRTRHTSPNMSPGPKTAFSMAALVPSSSVSIITCNTSRQRQTCLAIWGLRQKSYGGFVSKPVPRLCVCSRAHCRCRLSVRRSLQEERERDLFSGWCDVESCLQRFQIVESVAKAKAGPIRRLVWTECIAAKMN